ncbi:hypothetical protein K2173_022706 [Erythroxylum novogranatense]|uniref:Uncharacterized protein n=1 Tax=Erythroxylum novogranatense TaxID=1862640 RepID=A0AAV8TNY3_9ROSI|nr:hypothetical protein K2173_022706 [Erythroxylum novogranatense]
MKQCEAFALPVVFFLILLVADINVDARKYGPTIKPEDGNNGLSSDQYCTTHNCFTEGNVNITIKPTSSGGDSSGHRESYLTWNDFSQNGGSGAAECTEQYYPSTATVVALSTDLFENMRTCGKAITIYYGSRRSKATVVDQCDVHDGCRRNSIDASTEVWHDLGVVETNPIFGGISVSWSMDS